VAIVVVRDHTSVSPVDAFDVDDMFPADKAVERWTTVFDIDSMPARVYVNKHGWCIHHVIGPTIGRIDNGITRPGGGDAEAIDDLKLT
jgi:hypothetical protein